MNRVNDLFGATVAYEMYALASGRVPTITTLCRRRRLLIPVVLGVVLAHFFVGETVTCGRNTSTTERGQ